MRTGALWIYLQGGLSSAIQFLAGIALARIMDPSDFGVFYAVTAYTSILLLQTQFGIPSSLIRAKELTDAQWNAAFWFMQGIALVCVLGIVFLSSWLQGFYDDDRFTLVMWLMATTLVITPISSIFGTRLRREMDYKTVSQIQILTGLLAVAVSISCALLGFGPFSLVIAGIVSGLLSAFLLARKISWRPSRAIDFKGLRTLFNYGWWLHINNSLSMGAKKVDNMLVGSLTSIFSLGIYNRALSSAQMPVTEISGRLYELFFSGLSRIQDDMEHTILMYKKVLCAMTIAVFPFLLVFIFAAEGFINFLYGEKWLPAAQPLQILAFGSMPYVIAVTMGALADAQNLVSKETPIQIFNLIFTAVAVWIGSSWGLNGIAIGIAMKSIFLMLMLQSMLSRSHVSLSWPILLDGIYPAIAASGIAAISALVTSNLLTPIIHRNGFFYLCILTSVIFFTYGATLYILFRIFPENEALSSNIEMIKTTSLKLIQKIMKKQSSE